MKCGKSEMIYHEFQAMDEKICKALGSTLGLHEQIRKGLFYYPPAKLDFIGPDYKPTLLPVDDYLTAHF